MVRRGCDYQLECDSEGIVGLDGSWYCLEHFDKRLKGVGEFIKKMHGMFAATLQPADGEIEASEQETQQAEESVVARKPLTLR